MTSFLFWNLNKKPLSKEIAKLCHNYSIDILILAENDISEDELLLELNKGVKAEYISAINLSPKLAFFIRFSTNNFLPIRDEGGIAVRALNIPIGIEIIVVGVHLPSKLYMKEGDQIFNSVRLAEVIREVEEELGHSNTLVVGDFNMNPFESGFISAGGLHAVMDKTVARKLNRKVQGVNFPFFYNPMWRILGDSISGPAGTYYYSDSSYECYFWNTFDQVIIRPQLIPYFQEDSLEIVKHINDIPLIDENGVPDKHHFSDHLPILFNLKFERGS